MEMGGCWSERENGNGWMMEREGEWKSVDVGVRGKMEMGGCWSERENGNGWMLE
jgi:hypothetical protein